MKDSFDSLVGNPVGVFNFFQIDSNYVARTQSGKVHLDKTSLIMRFSNLLVNRTDA